MTTPDPVAEPSRLERRYRRLLRALPAWYRAARADEMVDAFLATRPDDQGEEGDLDATHPDDLDLEHGWPGWGEAAAVLGLAVRTRFAARSRTAGPGGSAVPDGASAGQAPDRAVLVGDATRWLALLGLLAQSVLTVAELAGAALRGSADTHYPFVGDDPVSAVSGAAAAAAFLLLLAGRRRWARLAGVVAVLPSLVGLAGSTPWLAVAVSLPLGVSVAALLLGFHDEAADPPAAPWLRAGSVSAAVVLGWVAVVGLTPVGRWPLALVADPASLRTWALLLGALVHLVALRRSVRRPAVVSAALAVALLAVLPERVGVAVAAGQLHAAGVVGGAPRAVALTQLAAAVVLAAALLRVPAPLPTGGTQR